MARTGQQLLDTLDELLDDGESYTTTATGTTTTLIDSELSIFSDDRLLGQWVRFTSGDEDNEIHRITGFTSSTGTITFTPAASGNIASGVTYELHKWNPNKKFDAIDAARFEVVDDVFVIEQDATITADGMTNEFAIPSTMTYGPDWAIIEKPLAVDVDWNFIQDPKGDDTTNWTASAATASTVSKLNGDRNIPKLEQTCTYIAVAGSVNGTYTQPVASMVNGVTAALAAGRDMEFGAWVYCLTPSRVSVKLIDDSTTTTSSLHQGRGWEYLSVTKEIAAANSTTLSARFDVINDTAAVDFWWERAVLTYGRIPNFYDEARVVEAQRDDTLNRFWLRDVPPRGYQIRLLGKSLPTAISRTDTASVEVDEARSKILCAQAARILLSQEALSTQEFQLIDSRLKSIENRVPDIKRLNRYVSPRGKITGPFHA